MSQPLLRPHSSRPSAFLLSVSAALALLFVSLVFYHLLNRDRYLSDPRNMQELSALEIEDTPLKSVDNDWPQWRGRWRDGLSRETGILTAWPDEGPPRLWDKKIGKGFSAVAVAAGRVYLLFQDADHEAVVCWNAADGQELWRFRYPAQFLESYGDGPRSTPTVDGDCVYTVGATGIMHCLRTQPASSKGEVVWRSDLLAEYGARNLRWGTSFSPLIEGELVYTNPGGPNGNSLAALNKRTGQLVWKSLDDPAGYSSPIAATIAGQRQIIFFTQLGLVGVTPDTGAELWRFPWETSYGCNVATPIVVQDYVFISSGYQRGCAVVKIQAQGDGTFTAERVYEHTRLCNHFSSCVLYKDHLYGFHDVRLVCMEFRTGTIRWTKMGFRKGSLLIADGHLLILGEKGNLALAEANPEGYRSRAELQLFPFSERPRWTMPVLANGRLYLRDEDSLVCLDLRKK